MSSYKNIPIKNDYEYSCSENIENACKNAPKICNLVYTGKLQLAVFLGRKRVEKDKSHPFHLKFCISIHVQDVHVKLSTYRTRSQPVNLSIDSSSSS